MTRRRVLQAGALLWAVVGFAIAMASLDTVNSDGRLIVALAGTLGPLAAVIASINLAGGRDRTAGAFLLVSVVTPTYFAWVLNVPALLIGLLLMVAPGVLADRAGRVAAPSH